MPKTLYVVSVVANPLSWNSRSKLFHEFVSRMLKKREELKSEYALELCIVECLYENQTSFIAEDLRASVNYTSVNSKSVVWNKENLVNIGISNLPADWKYVAWVDGDISFLNEDWVKDTIETLDSSAICQLWTEAHDLGQDGRVMLKHRSFCSQVSEARLCQKMKLYTTWHSGYAWGATKQAIEAIGGLYDKGILGSADNYMAWALVGRLDLLVTNRQISAGELDFLYKWQERALQFRNSLAAVPGTIEHHYHGTKKSRGYSWRWKIAATHDFEPTEDVSYNADGVLEFAGNKPNLESAVLDYFQSRDEDAIEVVPETFAPGEWHE